MPQVIVTIPHIDVAMPQTVCDLSILLSLLTKAAMPQVIIIIIIIIIVTLGHEPYVDNIQVVVYVQGGG
jgi:hypothetical protein